MFFRVSEGESVKRRLKVFIPSLYHFYHLPVSEGESVKRRLKAYLPPHIFYWWVIVSEGESVKRRLKEIFLSRRCSLLSICFRRRIRKKEIERKMLMLWFFSLSFLVSEGESVKRRLKAHHFYTVYFVGFYGFRRRIRKKEIESFAVYWQFYFTVYLFQKENP